MAEKCVAHFGESRQITVEGAQAVALYKAFAGWVNADVQRKPPGWAARVDDKEVVINFHLVAYMELSGKAAPRDAD